MKLSKLRALCDKAIEKYGDMTVGTYDKDYAHDLDDVMEMTGLSLRVLVRGKTNLPGESIDPEEDQPENNKDHFVCIFYGN